jgi:two-component system, sporulation sensor kinase E
VDNGIGMSSDVQGKIGTPFFTTKEKGTGLGLGISYQIMSEHNGRIEVESAVGKGTTFKIIFSQIENLI